MAQFVFDRKAYEDRMQWYVHDRFGMFIHWGLYAIPARGEWVRSEERISPSSTSSTPPTIIPGSGPKRPRRRGCSMPS